MERSVRASVLMALLVAALLAVPLTVHPGVGPPCFGVTSTVVGGPEDNNVDGTSSPDVMWLDGGDDTARGRGGDDLICSVDGQTRSKGMLATTASTEARTPTISSGASGATCSWLETPRTSPSAAGGAIC